MTLNVAKDTKINPNPRVQLWTTNDQTGAIATPIYSVSTLVNANSSINNRGTIQNNSVSKVNNVAVLLGGNKAKLVNLAGGVVSAEISAKNLTKPISTSTVNTSIVFFDGTLPIKAGAPHGVLNGPVTTYGFDAAAIGVDTELHGHNVVENHGIISARHAGIGKVWAVAAAGKADTFALENYGTISAERTQPLILTTNTAASLKGTVKGAEKLKVASTSYGEARNIAYAAGFFTEEEQMESTVHNHKGGTILGSGDLTAALYMRSNILSITNDGTISYNKGAGSVGGGVAIVSYEAPFNEVEDGFLQIIIGKTALKNTGNIIGDVRMVDVNGLAEMASRVAGYDQSFMKVAGRRDSAIDNIGTMQNLVLGTGDHKLTNSGTIAGNINVNQTFIYKYAATNATNNYPAGTFAAGQSATACLAPDVPLKGCLPSKWFLAGDEVHSYLTEEEFLAANPDKRFALENSGTITGNVTIATVAGSHITISPVITAESSENNSSIQGTLKIADAKGISSADSTAVIKPIVSSSALVKSGQSYTVAKQFFGEVLPKVESSGNVSWIAKKVSNALVIEATVK
ncbi:MAG: hypothetical protein HOO90_10125 [Methylotenera sp.]|uniref:hypothetical protein n=1 Tax=Methylotenera sp. TaxID=2051956 RepID=UPI001807C45D|nr:hypothetical protein [Methylotenera sp.]NOU25873.1 hypothetical protein [Methylotenera sp.]